MADLYVDLDALGTLSAQMSQIKATLEAAPDRAGASAGELGSARIDDALGDFVDGWRDGRTKIIGGIDALAGRTEGAAGAYVAQEQALASAAGGGSGSSPPGPER